MTHWRKTGQRVTWCRLLGDPDGPQFSDKEPKQKQGKQKTPKYLWELFVTCLPFVSGSHLSPRFTGRSGEFNQSSAQLEPGFSL